MAKRASRRRNTGMLGVEQLAREFEAIKSKNAEISERKCREVLQQLNLPITKKLKSGTYMSSGGYIIYQQDLQQLQTNYRAKQGLGVKAKDTIATFLHEKWAEGQTILAADQKVSEEEKKVEVERQKVLQARRDREAAERQSQTIAKHAEDMERTMKENLAQLERRRQEDLTNMQNHYDNVIQTRLVEQERTMQEGFKREADSMRAQISQMAEEKRANDRRYAEEAEQTRKTIERMTVENQQRAEMNERKTREMLTKMSEAHKKKEEELRKSAEVREKKLRKEMKDRISEEREISEWVMPPKTGIQWQPRNDQGCFADTSLIKVKGSDGRVVSKPLSEVVIGDSVESFDFKTGEVVFSAIYFITHSEDSDTNTSELLFLKLEQVESDDSENGIRLDANHLLYVSRADEMPSAGPPLEQPIKAGEVVVGDKLWMRQHSGLETKKIEEIRRVRSGIRHPMTMNHVIIVDGILASVHMYHETLYRALTSPLRLLYSFSPAVVKSSFVRNLVNAWDYVENFL